MGNHPSLYKYYSTSQFNNESVVVITGASSGMGRELAFRYAQRGCKVVIAARREERLNGIKEECNLQFRNQNIHAVPCDVSDED